MIVLLRGRHAHVDSASPIPEPVILPLVSLQGEQNMPAFSPDGSRVAFMWRAPNQAQSGIYAAVVGSQSLVRLSQSGDDYSPAWSPDGRDVAFLHDSGERFHIHTVAALGGNEKNIYTGLLGPLNYNAANYGLSFCSNGKLLTFCEWNPEAQRTGIRLLSLADSSARFLTLPPLGFNDRRPAFSPSGDRIAFVRSSGPIYVDELVVISLTDGRTRQLTFDHKRIFGAPSWTPDGREIIYSSNRAGLANVWRISAEGGTRDRSKGLAPLPGFLQFHPRVCNLPTRTATRNRTSGELNCGMRLTREAQLRSWFLQAKLITFCRSVLQTATRSHFRRSARATRRSGFVTGMARILLRSQG